VGFVDVPLTDLLSCVSPKESLRFSQTEMSGTIPDYLWNFAHLSKLFWQSTGVGHRLKPHLFLTLCIPFEDNLQLAMTDMAGTLPASIMGLVSLGEFRSSVLDTGSRVAFGDSVLMLWCCFYCMLTQNLCSSSERLILSIGSFSGTIPSEIGRLTKLGKIAADSAHDVVWRYLLCGLDSNTFATYFLSPQRP
jgi:hypothetical protein